MADYIDRDAAIRKAEKYGLSDEARSRLSNADFQRALCWLFDHYDFT